MKNLLLITFIFFATACSSTIEQDCKGEVVLKHCERVSPFSWIEDRAGRIDGP